MYTIYSRYISPTIRSGASPDPAPPRGPAADPSPRARCGGRFPGKPMGKPWENRGKTIGKWENHRKTMGKPWENGKTLGKP